MKSGVSADQAYYISSLCWLLQVHRLGVPLLDPAVRNIFSIKIALWIRHWTDLTTWLIM